MEKKMKIEGMMCNHCRMTVEKALKGVDGVTDAAVNLEEKTATVTLAKDVADQTLMDAVAAKNFTPVAML